MHTYTMQAHCVHVYSHPDVDAHASMSGSPALYAVSECRRVIAPVYCSAIANWYALQRVGPSISMSTSILVLSIHDSVAIATRQRCYGDGVLLPSGMKQLRNTVPIEHVVDMASYHYTCCSTRSDMLIYVCATVLTHRAMSTAPLYYITTTTSNRVLDLRIGMMMVCVAAYPPRRTPVCDVVHALPSWAQQLRHI